MYQQGKRRAVGFGKRTDMITMPNRVLSQKSPRIRYRGPLSAETHEGFPALVYAMPDVVFALTAAEREARAVVSSDLCILDDSRFFIRCGLSVPVLGCTDGLGYGPWVEVRVRDFTRYAVHFNGSGHPAWSAAEGRLANAFPAHAQTTAGLSCMIRLPADPTQRPAVEILDHDHPIAHEQIDGMSLPRAMEIVSQMKGFLLLVN
jgi:hypothetical protein